MYSKLYKLLPGDRIITPLFQTGLAKHFAIYLGKDKSGIEWITENHKFTNVQIIPASQYFASMKKIDRIEKFKGSNAERILAVKRALQLAGKSYDLVNYNCEHFANEVLTGQVESRQIRNVFAGLISIFLIGLLINE